MRYDLLMICLDILLKFRYVRAYLTNLSDLILTGSYGFLCRALLTLIGENHLTTKEIVIGICHLGICIWLWFTHRALFVFSVLFPTLYSFTDLHDWTAIFNSLVAAMFAAQQ